MFSFVICPSFLPILLDIKEVAIIKVPYAFLTVSWDALCWVTSVVSLYQLPSSGVESMSHYHFNFFADEKYFYY